MEKRVDFKIVPTGYTLLEKKDGKYVNVSRGKKLKYQLVKGNTFALGESKKTAILYSYFSKVGDLCHLGSPFKSFIDVDNAFVFSFGGYWRLRMYGEPEVILGKVGSGSIIEDEKNGLYLFKFANEELPGHQAVKLFDSQEACLYKLSGLYGKMEGAHLLNISGQKNGRPDALSFTFKRKGYVWLWKQGKVVCLGEKIGYDIFIRKAKTGDFIWTRVDCADGLKKECFKEFYAAKVCLDNCETVKCFIGRKDDDTYCLFNDCGQMDNSFWKKSDKVRIIVGSEDGIDDVLILVHSNKKLHYRLFYQGEDCKRYSNAVLKPLGDKRFSLISLEGEEPIVVASGSWLYRDLSIVIGKYHYPVQYLFSKNQVFFAGKEEYPKQETQTAAKKKSFWGWLKFWK